MNLLTVIVQVMSGAMLLLFAVRLIRSGIEKQFGAWVRAQFDPHRSLLGLLSKGAGLGFVMQGGTVVLLMGASLAAQGMVPIGGAAILAIGAELGSALAVNVLHQSTSSFAPFLVLIGGWSYLNSPDTSKVHNIGLILLGLGLVFSALDVIRHAIEPLQSSEHVAGALTLIGTDPINAALLGVLLAFLMHSSVVAMLTAAVLVTGGALSVTAAIGFMLGCNIGSALLPLWLLRSEPKPALQVAHIVALLRIALAIIVLATLFLIRQSGYSFPDSVTPVTAMLIGHIFFNLSLWPFASLANTLSRLLASRVRNVGNALHASDMTLRPELILATFKRQVNVMMETLGAMVDNATAAYPDSDEMSRAEIQMNQGLIVIRQQYADLPPLSLQMDNHINAFMDFAIRVERSADLLAGKYMNIRAEEKNGLFHLSDEGKTEITKQLTELQTSLILSQHVLWKEDPSDARQLIELKQRMAKLEQYHKRQHFNRIRSHHPNEMNSSNQYLEIIAALQEISSKLATIGYVVLDRHGELKKSRLKSIAPS